jgi:hypothetical protein
MWTECQFEKNLKILKCGFIGFMSTSNFSSGLRWPEALQMIGNCCKLTVIFVAGNPFVDEAWLKNAQNTQDPGTCQKTSVPPLSCSPTVSTPWIWNWVEFIIWWINTWWMCRIHRPLQNFPNSNPVWITSHCQGTWWLPLSAAGFVLLLAYCGWRGANAEIFTAKGVHPTLFWPLMPSETHSGEQKITFRPVGPRQTLP